MSTYYTSKYSGEQIDEAVKKIMDGEMTGDYADRQLSNLDTPQGALANLGAGVRPSLVDNGIFVGPNLPVNQRGDTSWSTSGYHLDRWFFEQAAACSIADDGLHIGKEQTITQAVDADTKDFFLGKTITVSALLSDGSFASATGVVALDGNGIFCHPKSGFDYGTFFFSSGSYQISRMFNHTGQEVTLVACKTEFGSTQTLAYQDDEGAWQLLPQPESDYATQLLKCQKYLFDCGNGNASYPAMINGTSGIATIQTPVQMAKTPVLVKKSSGYGVIYVNGSSIAVTNATVDICAGNFVTISFQIAQSVVSNCVWRECTFWLDTGM